MMLKRLIENTLYSARWLLAPIYLGLSLILFVLAIKFFQETIHIFAVILSTTEKDLVLLTLSLIDLAMLGGLIVMVMFSGYELFVARLDVGSDEDRLSWLGKLDAGSLKLKIAASIVAISSIHLLRAFMNVEQIPNDKLIWYVTIHMTFVASAVAMGWLGKMMSHR
uniref:UPF0114 protein BECKLFY1418A_GA0070994_109610 n=1 Tax=Candidatus Kentrum sp. LFY TaxID=2126342 RepID=A0A450WFK7_9GAMM|nr:MAG: TIGR00645 family protein [Candidatus Kentron sp. LFY]VFJ99278.1 MAG: TIGR00645 family protein [Candidatus Kentron sp. LFY]VFK15795.1 MAG: TIGR00645 family protein [Candidatus Kentron sp. LFY]